MLQDDLVQVVPLGRAEVLPHRDLRDLLPGRQGQGSGVGGCLLPPPPLLQNVDVVQLCRLPPPWLADPVVHLPHAFHHLVGSLPLGQEPALRRGDQDQDQVPWLKGPQLGSTVVDPRLGLLGSLEVPPDDGPHPGHAVTYLLHVIHGGAVGGRLALPGLLCDIQDPAGSPPVQKLKGGEPGGRLGDLPYREQYVG